MEELVQRLSEKTGLSQDKSQEVVNVVVARLKERLPEPLANSLDRPHYRGREPGGEGKGHGFRARQHVWKVARIGSHRNWASLIGRE